MSGLPRAYRHIADQLAHGEALNARQVILGGGDTILWNAVVHCLKERFGIAVEPTDASLFRLNEPDAKRLRQILDESAPGWDQRAKQS